VQSWALALDCSLVSSASAAVVVPVVYYGLVMGGTVADRLTDH